MPILGLQGWVIAVGSALLGCCPGSVHAAEIPVDLELVLAIDSSGSVNAREFDLQQRGIAMAFRDPEVLEAIATTTPQGLALSVVQWSGRGQQHIAIDWTLVDDQASALAFADRVDAFGRLVIGETAVAEALGFAIAQLERNDFAGDRRTIDISGDGPTNARLAPDAMRDAAAAAGITINGLAIVNEIPDVDRYYAWHVIGGPGAFLMTAKDYRDFAEAMRLKLLQEIRGGPVATRPAPRFASRLPPRDAMVHCPHGCPVRLAPGFLDHQVRNVAYIIDVARDEDQAVLMRGRGDQRVPGRDHGPPLVERP